MPALPLYVMPHCIPHLPNGWSVARFWDERALDLIRLSSPAPGVHARNLFDLSAVMWDAWAAYDPTAQGYFVTDKVTSNDPEADRIVTMSYAAYHLLKWRYYYIPGRDGASQGLELAMERSLCLNPGYWPVDRGTPADFGNHIAAVAIKAGRSDGALEHQAHAPPYVDSSYVPANKPLAVGKPGAAMRDPNLWQPIKFPSTATDQSGRPVPGGAQVFLGAQWGHVKSFALPTPETWAPIDLGPPPNVGKRETSQDFKDAVVALLTYSASLDPGQSQKIDISPASLGNDTLGADDGHGHTINPATGKPYAPDIVLQADYRRALAEFWADGPNSETPPGHWNLIANAVADSPGFELRLGGTGAPVDRLEWDVKMYFVLNGALHDAAIAAWGLKRLYQTSRPISVIRWMAGRGQSSDPSLPSYDPRGLPLVPGLIELITRASSAPGERHHALRDHIGEIAVRTWRGFPKDPGGQVSGVGWILGTTWVPYQRVSFVTPAFPGYVSGHSTFSRAAAEILARLTGSEFFPGGMTTWTIAAGSLRHELGPTTDVTFEWATYYDAADAAGISRQYMGIHWVHDDLDGRRIGAECGIGAWDLANAYFSGQVQ